jgi:hypothetical protein
MRHMDQTRRVAVDNPVPGVSLAANPCSGSACACCRAYSLHAINSFLLPPGTPRADSSVTNPLHNQPCSTSSHRRCLPPSGHTAASPPRLRTTLTGAPFRSTTVYTYLFPQSQPSSRFLSHLLIASHPLHPSSQQERSSSPIISKSYFSVPQFPLALTLLSPNFLFCKVAFKRAGRALCIFFVILSIHWL